MEVPVYQDGRSRVGEQPRKDSLDPLDQLWGKGTGATRKVRAQLRQGGEPIRQLDEALPARRAAGWDLALQAQHHPGSDARGLFIVGQLG